ncbi:MAG: mannitol-1-phosphate 5-dehydrogenase [Oligosphaeraceae bacterium]|nr:mannitol-1-phosphate 5-dehydrogenase [Oligosphaeraceae bacterium]
MSKTAVIFGAGNIGRGFIGQLFSESGYEVVFVDVDKELVAALNERGQYHLQIISNFGYEDLQIGPVRAIHGNDADAVAAAVAEADLAATAVGANALKYIVDNIVAGLCQRAKMQAAPINFIVCENLHGAAAYLRGLCAEKSKAEGKAYLEKQTGFVDTVIGRMVPAPTPEMRQQDPCLIRTEAYKELPVQRSGFVGEIPDIVAMSVEDNFEVFTARKLYIHNCGHALMAYAGYLRGYEYGYEVMADAKIRNFMLAGLQESAAGISAALGADELWLQRHVEELIIRFDNRLLGDPVFRLGRDPIRKLALEDRLTGAAKMALGQGLPAKNLAWGMAMALHFDPAEDESAQKLQRCIREMGVEKALMQVAGLQQDDPLVDMVIKAYRQLELDRLALPH